MIDRELWLTITSYNTALNSLNFIQEWHKTGIMLIFVYNSQFFTQVAWRETKEKQVLKADFDSGALGAINIDSPF